MSTTSTDESDSLSPSPVAPNAPKFGTLIPNRIFVGGIAASTTESELHSLFASYGNVKATKIILDRAGVSKGYGFVTFETEEEARRIQREADVILKDKKLNIAPAIKKQPFARVYEPTPVVPNGTILYPSGIPFTYPKKLGNAGLLGITRPTKYGGLGLDYSFTVAFIEELSNINSGGVPMSITVHTDMSTPALSRFGSEELKQEFLVPSIKGDVVSCVGISEVHCGSDVAGITTKAVRKGDDFIINGGKMWITNGPQADWMCMLANTSDGPPHKNKSLICVPLNLPGITFNRIHKLGTCSSDTAQFFFEDVRVPAKNIIGDEGMGFIYQMLQFQDERLAAIIGTPPGLSRTIQETIAYCKERAAFGQPIINNQVIHYTLAELQSEVEALKSLIYRAAAAMIDGQDVTLLASMAKLKAGRLAREVTDKCLQFWGGMGYSSDVNISRKFRDARLMSIAGGSDEVMLSIISKFMGTFPKGK